MKKILLIVCLIIFSLCCAQAIYSITSLKKVKNVHVLTKGNTYITLAWNKVKHATKYKINVLNRNKNQIRTVKTENLKKRIENLTRNEVYYFKLCAKKGKISGPWSDLKKIRTTNLNENNNLNSNININSNTNTPLPTIDFSTNAYSGTENGGLITITVNTSATSNNDIASNYATTDNTALAGTDYTLASGTITIQAGSTSTTFTINPISDIDNESDETLTVSLSDPSQATLADVNNPATVTIADDDSLTVSSPNFTNNGAIPVDFTCDGSDINPELNWISAPTGTQSFILIVRDIDASDFMHWGVKDISSSTASVAQNNIPTGGTELFNDFAIMGYNGPCPPGNENHRYQWEIYALSTNHIEASTIAELENNMQEYILEQHYITGTYGS